MKSNMPLRHKPTVLEVLVHRASINQIGKIVEGNVNKIVHQIIMQSPMPKQAK